MLQYSFCFRILVFGFKACDILAPLPGIEPAPFALEGNVLTIGPPSKSQADISETYSQSSLETLQGNLVHSRIKVSLPFFPISLLQFHVSNDLGSLHTCKTLSQALLLGESNLNII